MPSFPIMILRRPAAVLAVLACLAASGAMAAETFVTPRRAMQAMRAAGYSGVGGVTRDDPFYYAAAIAPDGRRVRVTVDGRNAQIVRVLALPRGAGSVRPGPTPLPQPEPFPRIEAEGAPSPLPASRPPRATKPIGVVQSPRTVTGGVSPAWCRYRADAPGC